MRRTIDDLRAERDGAGADATEREYRRAAERAANIAHPLFVKHGWVWIVAGSDNRYEVPSWGRIYSTVLSLIRRVGDGESVESGTGRFEARLDESTVEVRLDVSECDARVPDWQRPAETVLATESATT